MDQIPDKKWKKENPEEYKRIMNQRKRKLNNAASARYRRREKLKLALKMTQDSNKKHDEEKNSNEEKNSTVNNSECLRIGQQLSENHPNSEFYSNLHPIKYRRPLTAALHAVVDPLPKKEWRKNNKDKWETMKKHRKIQFNNAASKRSRVKMKKLETDLKHEKEENERLKKMIKALQDKEKQVNTETSRTLSNENVQSINDRFLIQDNDDINTLLEEAVAMPPKIIATDQLIDGSTKAQTPRTEGVNIYLEDQSQDNNLCIEKRLSKVSYLLNQSNSVYISMKFDNIDEGLKVKTLAKPSPAEVQLQGALIDILVVDKRLFPNGFEQNLCVNETMSFTNTNKDEWKVSHKTEDVFALLKQNITKTNSIPTFFSMAYFESNSVFHQLKDAQEVLTSSDVFDQVIMNEYLREIDISSPEGMEIFDKKPVGINDEIICDICKDGQKFVSKIKLYKHKHNIHKVDRNNVTIHEDMWRKWQ